MSKTHLTSTLEWDEVFDCAVAAWCRSSTSQEMLRMCFQSRTQRNEVSVGWTANELMAFAKGVARLVAAPQQAPCQTCTALARTVMLDQVSFDRTPDCYGIRQITDDEGIEEWEDIRTSPDVAREEANDMMATGRGEIYEVVPLWTTPQPTPTPQADSQPAPQQEAQEPVAWQSRTRPTWGGNDRPWSPWEPCTKGQAEDYWKTPLLHDWAYEARALYTAPQPLPASQGDALDALEAARKYGAESWDDWLKNKVDAAIEAARAAQEGKSHDE